MNTVTKQKIKKVFSIVGNVLMYTFLVLCLVSLIFTISASRKAENESPSFFGHKILLVLTGSMEKNDAVDVSEYKIKDIPQYSAVIVKERPDTAEEFTQWCSELQVGDVLTFKYLRLTGNLQDSITHRIIAIEYHEDEGGYRIELAGDNNISEVTEKYGDTQVIYTWNDEAYGGKTNEYIEGKVVGKSNVLGLLLYVMKQPVGIICLIIIPCAVIILLELIHIITTLNAEKVRKAREAQQAQEEEIEKLRRQIAVMQSGAAPPEAEAVEMAEAEPIAVEEAEAVEPMEAEPIETEEAEAISEEIPEDTAEGTEKAEQEETQE